MKPLKWIGYTLLIVGLSLALLSAFWPTPAGGGTPPAPAPTRWHTVATYEGYGSKSTRSFTVTGMWRIAWRTSPGPLGEGEFRVFLYEPTGDMVEEVVNAIGKSRSSCELHRDGTYYLEISGSQPYAITVQERA